MVLLQGNSLFGVDIPDPGADPDGVLYSGEPGSCLDGVLYSGEAGSCLGGGGCSGFALPPGLGGEGLDLDGGTESLEGGGISPTPETTQYGGTISLCVHIFLQFIFFIYKIFFFGENGLYVHIYSNSFILFTRLSSSGMHFLRRC